MFLQYHHDKHDNSNADDDHQHDDNFTAVLLCVLCPADDVVHLRGDGLRANVLHIVVNVRGVCVRRWKLRILRHRLGSVCQRGIVQRIVLIFRNNDDHNDHNDLAARERDNMVRWSQFRVLRRKSRRWI